MASSGTLIPSPLAPQADLEVRVSFSVSSLTDFLSVPSVRDTPLAAGLSLVPSDNVWADVKTRQALLPLVSSSALMYDLLSSLRRLAAMQSWEVMDWSVLLTSMASLCKASVHLLKGPTVDGLLCALRAHLHCCCAATH